MTKPIMLSTWSFGRNANAAGWPSLTGPRQSSLDAVEQACRAVEGDPDVLSVGYGGCPDRCGDVSLDAAIMLSPTLYGAVSCVRRFANPVSIARLILDRLHRGMLTGEGAERFATRLGLEPANLLSQRAQTLWRDWISRNPGALIHDDAVIAPPANLEESNDPPQLESEPHNRFHDTVGSLAMDPLGQIAAACSTSGLPFKLPGRVGDSPIVGHGLYVDPRRGAAVCTGEGELIMGVCGSFLAVETMGRGESPKNAARQVIQRIAEEFQIEKRHQAAIIAIDTAGNWSAASLRPGYHTAIRTADRDELVPPEFVMFQ